MNEPDFSEISTGALREYLNHRSEREFLLMDVRQPMEYEMGHIPGATLTPLSEFESRLFDLPTDRDLIFYCRSGARSAAAASMAAAGEVTDKEILNLSGGFLAWEGKTLTGFPKVRTFDNTRSVTDLLYTAMDLEKGAWRFYRHLLDSFTGEPIEQTIDTLSKAETAHAKLVYRFWKAAAVDARPFEAVFDQLPGEILEGGERLAEMLRQVDALEGDRCLNVIELALHIEYTAYDLYRSMAERVESKEASEALLSISQAEKAHMRALSRAIGLCG
jgi:rhodanese-related sulfurtransferase/rubrerythrin